MAILRLKCPTPLWWLVRHRPPLAHKAEPEEEIRKGGAKARGHSRRPGPVLRMLACSGDASRRGGRNGGQWEHTINSGWSRGWKAPGFSVWRDSLCWSNPVEPNQAAAGAARAGAWCTCRWIFVKSGNIARYLVRQFSWSFVLCFAESLRRESWESKELRGCGTIPWFERWRRGWKSRPRTRSSSCCLWQRTCEELPCAPSPVPFNRI